MGYLVCPPAAWSLALLEIPFFATRNDKAMYCNLRSICTNYAALGVTRFLPSRAVESRSELEIVRGSVSATDVTVCRLTASVETLELRVKMRESGISQQEYVSRVADLNVILDHAHIEDFALINESRAFMHDLCQ